MGVFEEHVHAASWQTPDLSAFSHETEELEKGG